MNESKKKRQLEQYVNKPEHDNLTTNEGTKIPDNQNQLKAGRRGPSLLEDFHFRQKMTHFDHERTPERIVHARGFAAHGVFKLSDSLSDLTCADFLTSEGKETPVFVRFSTVAGNKGSAETVRDVRGFAVKFYTEHGNFDLVGNNIPIFFIQDAVKFPDLIHAVKQEPHHNMPQAASAHDTFYDFISLMPEAMAMHIWQMSDRTIPRSARMMEGFGIHTYRLLTQDGEAHLVKWHWKPRLGLASLVWDEAQKVAGMNPDFLNEDLWTSIEDGDYPQWELGLQVFSEEQASEWDFDILDPTKIVPEELVPVRRVGTMTLNRNVDNFFAETEQVAFHPGNIVPGIDFTNDPLLQGRLHSYLDTQLIRLGGPNFSEIPINRPVVSVTNNQRDGFSRHRLDRGKVAYEPNALAKGCPFAAGPGSDVFQHYMEKMEGHKVRERSESFSNHFTQATLFWNSQTETEQQHIVDAASFEVSKVTVPEIRERMVQLYYNVSPELGQKVAKNLGVEEVTGDLGFLEKLTTAPLPSDAGQQHDEVSDALSIEKNGLVSAETLKVAVLLEKGFDQKSYEKLSDALTGKRANVVPVGPRTGPFESSSGSSVQLEKTFQNSGSPLFDAVVLLGDGETCDSLASSAQVYQFVLDAYNHKKPLLAIAGAGAVLQRFKQGPGVLVDSDPAEFVECLEQRRFWNREPLELF
jgi:catalase